MGAEEPTLSKHPESQQTPCLQNILPVKSTVTPFGKNSILFCDDDHDMIVLTDYTQQTQMTHHVWVCT